MSDKQKVQAITHKNNASFVVQCTSVDDLMIAVHYGSIVEGKVTIKFDNDPPLDVHSSDSADYQSHILYPGSFNGSKAFLDDRLKLLKLLKTKSKVAVRAGLYADNPNTSVFTLSGSNKAINKVEKTCGITNSVYTKFLD